MPKLKTAVETLLLCKANHQIANSCINLYLTLIFCWIGHQVISSIGTIAMVCDKAGLGKYIY